MTSVGLEMHDSAADRRVITAVAFDLDGTITDSLECCLFALQSALTSVGVAPPSIDALRPTAGLPLMTSVPPMLSEASANEVDVWEVIRAYESCYPELSRKHTVVINGVAEVLVRLSEQVPLVVVTSKATATALDVLDHTNLSQFFSAVVGSDRASALKPNSEPLIEVCGLIDVAPRHVAMIGDADVDMIMARAAGSFALGVDWGAASSSELEDAGAHCVVTSPSGVLDVLCSR